MSYIPYTYAPAGSDGKKVIYIPVPSGGLMLSDGVLPNGKSSVISNFDILNDGILTRKGFVCLSQSIPSEGQLHGITKTLFYGKTVVHVGTKLYSYGELDSEITEISASLPDEKSIFCMFMSKLYIYCKGHVFSLDKDFIFMEQVPDSALVFENASPIAAHGMKENGKAFNLVAPRVTVSYNEVAPQSDYSGTRYVLPRYADTSRPVSVFVNDEEIDNSLINVAENRILINREVNIPSGADVVKISYFVKDTEELSYDDKLYGCNLSVAFGGNTNGGTRVFFTGNENHKGYYFRSDLQNPLYFGSDECEVIGDGCENVTAVMKMYGNLLIFTENSVFKMSHNITSNNVYYSVKEISNETGCDCPDSVQLIDNRVVFANSRKGVFIVDSANDTGEHNIKPISGNINEGFGRGLLECDPDKIKNSYSVDFDRKYMLVVGGCAYIWDYNASPFHDSGNYSKAQEKLCWYIYDDMHEGFYFESGINLVVLDKTDMSFYVLSDKGTKSDINFDVKSRDECFEAPLNKKYVTDMELSVCADVDAQVKLLLYSDGEGYFEKQLFVNNGKTTHVVISLPHKALYRFAFRLYGNGAVKVNHVMLKYKII